MATTIAAALTPLRAGGTQLDLDALEPYLAYLAAGGVEGALVLGTTGEGISLTTAERRLVLEAAIGGPLPVLAHCGAQTTADTVALAAHAAESGAQGVAVIAPPYFRVDALALHAHFAAAAAACAPLPFYVYEFEATSGYPVPVPVVERLRETSENLRGLKVSDAPFAKVEPYLLDGLDVYIGAEAVIGEGLAAGAAGCVSGLASAFPELVAEAVRTGDSAPAGELRAVIDRFPRHAALKAVVRSRGVPLREDVPRAASPPDRRRACRAPPASSRSSSIDCRARSCTSARRAAGSGRAGSGSGSAARVSASFVRRSSAGDGSAAGSERRRRSTPSPSAPMRSASRRFTARDATLPPLLAPPVAPSPEAASRRRGRFSP